MLPAACPPHPAVVRTWHAAGNGATAVGLCPLTITLRQPGVPNCREYCPASLRAGKCTKLSCDMGGSTGFSARNAPALQRAMLFLLEPCVIIASSMCLRTLSGCALSRQGSTALHVTASATVQDYCLHCSIL